MNACRAIIAVAIACWAAIACSSMARGEPTQIIVSVEYLTATSDVVARVQTTSGNEQRIIAVLKGTVSEKVIAAIRRSPWTTGDQIVFVRFGATSNSDAHVVDTLPFGIDAERSEVFGIDRRGQPLVDIEALAELVTRSTAIKLRHDDAPPGALQSVAPRRDPEGGVIIFMRRWQRSNDWAEVIIPLDDEAERWARTELGQQPGSARAVRVLAHLKNKENAALLRGSIPFQHSQSVYGSGRTATWEYFTRALAYRTLLRWGEPVTRPVLYGPADRYFVVRPRPIVCVVILIVLAQGRTLQRRRYAAIPIIAVRMMALVLMAAGVVLMIGLMLGRNRAIDFEISTSNERGWLTMIDRGLIWLRDDATFHGHPSARVGLFDFTYDPRTYFDLPPRTAIQSNVLDVLRIAAWRDAGKPIAGGTLPLRAVRVPLLRTTVATFALPAIVLVHHITRRRRARARRNRNECVHCGYDLRASPKRCPECGAIRFAARPASHAI